MTPFKERMNLYRAYREQNPDKNYWDWKQSLEVPAMQDGGNTQDYVGKQTDQQAQWEATNPPFVKITPVLFQEYKGPQYAESKQFKKQDPIKYNQLQYEMARRNSPSSEIVRYMDADGKYRSAVNMPSSEDPLYYLLPGTGDLAEILTIADAVKNKDYAQLALLPLAALPGNWINAIKKSSLNWRPDSWFGTRHGGIFSEDDVYALGSHLEEYLDIERAAKADGSWLKLPNGKLWQGDARSWVQLQSRDGKKLQLPSKVYKTGVKRFDVHKAIAGNTEKHRWLSDAPDVYNSFANMKGYAYYDQFQPQGVTFQLTTKKDPLTFRMDAEGRDFHRVKKTNDGWMGTDTAADYAKSFGADVLRIDNVVEGPHLNYNVSGDMVNPRTSTDLIILKGTPVKSLLGNNGNFDFDKQGIYFKNGGIAPAMQSGGENKLLQDPTVKTITFPDGSIVQTKHVWANQQGLQNTPIADMFNPMNDVYDFIQVGKDALEGNWAGVGTGLALAMVPNVIEKPLKGVIKRIGNRLRTHSPYAKSVDNYDKKVQEFFVNDVAPRMRNNDKLIDDYVNNADNFKYDVVDASEFDENVAGKFVPSRGVIEMNEAFNNRPDFQYILGHEQRHDLSNTISITPEQRKLLKQAYVVPDMPFTDRSHLWKEMEATNTQIRQILYEQLLREGEDVTVDMLNRYIDMIDDSTLADLLQNVNVYGQDYSKSLYKNGKLDKTAMLNFRNALKYVPAVVPAIVTPWMMSNIEDKSN